jgi:ribosomal protein L7/L12
MDDVIHLGNRVHELERLVAHLYDTLGVERPAADSAVSTRVRELVMQGNAMAAIKAYREDTGCDLLSAKKMIDSLM